MKPFLQSGSVMRPAITPTTRSSETSPPASITSFACLPTSVPAATAARSMSPVLSCGMPSASTILGACVPLPAPGGPNRIMILRAAIETTGARCDARGARDATGARARGANAEVAARATKSATARRGAILSRS